MRTHARTGSAFVGCIGLVALCLAGVLAAREAPSPEELELLLGAARRNASSADALVRTTAARDLELLTGVAAAKLAVELLGDSSASVRFAAITSLSRWEDEEALGWLASQGVRKGSATARATLLTALGLGRDLDSVHTAILESLTATSDEVKAAAIVALGRLGRREDADRIAAFAGDDSELVREAVAIALGAVGTSANLDAMRALVEDPQWAVRAAMISGMRRLEIKPVVSLLIARLAVESDRRVRADLQAALIALTGQDFGADPDLWLSWWEANKADFGVTEKIEIKIEKSDYAETTEYYGIKVESERILFVIDTSESMKKDDNLKKAKAELARVVSELSEQTRFNIMTYADSTELYKPAAVVASESNKAAALRWIEGINAKGLTTTDTYNALMTALGVSGTSIKAAARARPEHDTIFFLADGQPTTGITTDPEEILRDVRLANPDARLRIHTILLPTEGAIASRFMTSLATENGGQSITLGAQ